MAANTYLQVTELDFNDIRNNLKSYLASQSQFQDYDFEGSGMAVLLDLLAYNTHYNAYYLNMVANEMFLDTAQQRDSVVSIAKSLGYTPTSAIGASADVSLTFSGVSDTVGQFTVAEGSKFSAVVDDVTYTFVTTQSYTVLNNSSTPSVTVTIREGEPLSHRFVVDSTGTQRFIIPNTNVDTSSIKVSIQDNAASTTTVEWTKATNIREVTSQSKVYFLEESNEGKYEIVFGSGALGAKPIAGNVITIDYLVCNASATNGVSEFSVESSNSELVDVTIDSVSLTVVSAAAGGRAQESISSVKFNAPRNYQTQNRAVVAEDYQRILLSENADLQSVVSFGGEEYDPPTYGKVFISVKPFAEQFITETKKSQLRTSIIDRVPLAVDPVFIDAKYTYIIPTITTYFDKTRTTLSNAQIEQLVRNAVATYSTDNLERFYNRFRFSRFVRELDNISTDYILNNDVSVTIENRFVPNTQSPERITINYNNSIDRGSVSSTQFTFAGFNSYLDDDSLGAIRIYRFNSSREKVYLNVSAGTVDYTTGTVVINSFQPSAYSGIEMKVRAIPARLDMIPLREQILLINSSDAIVTAIAETV
jgi:hypothetical protein